LNKYAVKSGENFVGTPNLSLTSNVGCAMIWTDADKVRKWVDVRNVIRLSHWEPFRVVRIK
jgi:hypothetical protein